MSDETTIPEVEAVRSCLDRYVGDCVAADRVAGIEEEWAREDAGAGKEESGSALRAALSALETALRTARENYEHVRAALDSEHTEYLLAAGERDRARALLRERAWCEHCCGGGRRFGEACARCAGTGYPAPVWAEIGGEGE